MAVAAPTGGLSGRVVFAAEVEERSALFVLELATGLLSRASGDSFAALFPVVAAPRGEFVVVQEVGHDDAGARLERLWRWPLASGEEPRVLTPWRARNRNPALRPGTEQLAFESDEEGFSDVRLVSLQGGPSQRLTGWSEGAFEPAFSPAGETLYFVSSREGDPELYSLRLKGDKTVGAPRRLTAFHREDRFPRPAPDGQQLAFISNRDGREGVYIAKRDGSKVGRLSRACRETTNSPGGEPVSERQPTWSPDGTQVAWLAASADGSVSVWQARPDGSGCRQVSSSEAMARGFAWSPDGLQLLVLERSSSGSTWFRVGSSISGGGAAMPVPFQEAGAPLWLP